MATSKIVLKFNSVPTAGTIIEIEDSYTGIPMIETFLVDRTGIGETIIGLDTTHQMNFYGSTFALDYNNSFLYNLSYNNFTDELTITAELPQTQFSVNTNTTAGAVTTTITNEVVAPTFDFDTILALEAIDACNDVKLSLLMSEQADTINQPISQAVASNPFVFETTRIDSLVVQMQKGANIISQTLRMPKLLASYIDIDILGTPSGATVTVNRLFPLSDNGPISELFLLTFEYSLDNVIWQSSNSWSGLAEGNHTIYIRDNIGCSISILIVVAAFEGVVQPINPIFEISNLNSIRYKENVLFANCGTHKLVTNTLSFEERDARPLNKFTQKIQKCDTNRTQIKTSYETVTATLIDCDRVETPLNVFKMTENLNKTDVRDAYIVNHTDVDYNGSIGVYFGAGNTYDNLTLNQNGTYNTGSSVMTWLDVGEYVFLQGIGWLKILAIIPAPAGVAYSGDTLVLNGLSSVYGLANNSTIQATSLYNLVDFERFEVEHPFAALGGIYQIRINGTDAQTNYPDVEQLSEYLDVQEEHENCHEIIYYNSENNEMNYFTGIQNKIRIPYVFQLKWTPNVEKKGYVTDNNTVQTELRLRQFYEFNARPLPTAMAQKLVLALSQDRLFIDGENYLLESEPTSKSFGDTNLYQVKATLVKSNYVYDSDAGKGQGELVIPQGTPLSIDDSQPGLLFID